MAICCWPILVWPEQSQTIKNCTIWRGHSIILHRVSAISHLIDSTCLSIFFSDNIQMCLELISIEMISGSKQHSYEVDWWALGITLSELLIGHSPFLKSSSENPAEAVVCRRILHKEPDLTEIRSMDRTNANSPIERFIQALLIKDPTQRLGKSMNQRMLSICLWKFSFQISWYFSFAFQGTGQAGYEAIKCHEFFR